MYKKDQIIDEIRRIATNLGTKSLKQKDFNRRSKISLSSVRYHFSTWNDAVREAGLIPIDSREIIRKRELIDDNELLSDLIRLYNEYRKEPTLSLVNAKGKYSVRPYNVRWKNIKEAFLIAKKRFPEKISAGIKEQTKEQAGVESIKVIPNTIKPKIDKQRRIIFWRTYRFSWLTICSCE